MTAAAFAGMPVTAVIARSSLNIKLKAHSRLPSLVQSAFVFGSAAPRCGRLYLGYISAVSRLYLGCISAAPRCGRRHGNTVPSTHHTRDCATRA